MSAKNYYNNEIQNYEPSIIDIIDALPFYVMLVDSEHQIIMANRSVQTELGVEPEIIVGKYCPEVIHGQNEPFYACPLEEAVKKDKPIEREAFDSQTERWVNSAVYPIRGCVIGGKRVFFHMVTDITERKKIEEQLKQSENELHSLSIHLESVRDEEKKKIARDIHDGTNQVIASLNAYLEATVRLLPKGNRKIKAMLRKAQKLSTIILDELQKLIYEIRPQVLDDLGLIAAINSLVDNDLKAAGIKATIEIKGEMADLKPEKEISLYRIIQEAISNIIRHSGANNAEIGIQCGKRILKIRIWDNGKGFDINETTILKDRLRGFGLLGMKERAVLLGGTIDFKTQPNVSGTEINIKIPVN